ncbi:hypothetical protein PC116_g32120 [Phytophthora cactorum]|nr:hypothetical protein PC116_g32120 [Phytophthora cactorum]
MAEAEDMKITDAVEEGVDQVEGNVEVTIVETQGAVTIEAASVEAMISEDPPRRGRDVRTGVRVTKLSRTM